MDKYQRRALQAKYRAQAGSRSDSPIGTWADEWFAGKSAADEPDKTDETKEEDDR